jgi:hypothetical protein
VSGVGYRRWSGYGGIERSGGIEEKGMNEGDADRRRAWQLI